MRERLLPLSVLAVFIAMVFIAPSFSKRCIVFFLKSGILIFTTLMNGTLILFEIKALE